MNIKLGNPDTTIKEPDRIFVAVHGTMTQQPDGKTQLIGVWRERREPPHDVEYVRASFYRSVSDQNALLKTALAELAASANAYHSAVSQCRLVAQTDITNRISAMGEHLEHSALPKSFAALNGDE